MAQQMQDKILAALRKVAENAKLEFNVQHNYANTGRAYIQAGMRTLAEVKFDFQSTYCSIQIGGPRAHRALHANPPRWIVDQGAFSWLMLQYNDGERIEGMLGLFGKILDTPVE